jgi:hypothetical protein
MLSSSGVQLIAETDRAISPADQEDAPILTPSQAPEKSSSQSGWTARKSRATYR